MEDSDSASTDEDEINAATIVLNPNQETSMDVDSAFETYDSNTDGKINHSEYVLVHKDEVESGGISAVIDRLLDDSPELRGQRGVMFALSVLLVAAMNVMLWYEPEMVD